jgi:hypothetical protein
MVEREVRLHGWSQGVRPDAAANPCPRRSKIAARKRDAPPELGFGLPCGCSCLDIEVVSHKTHR